MTQGKYMRVILLKDVPRMGKAGEVKEVALGYGMNYLLPNELAEKATPGAMKRAVTLREHHVNEERKAARALQLQANALRDRSVIIRARAEEGRLFGSVGAVEIAAALVADGVDISTKQICLEKPFRKVGRYDVVAEFGPGVSAEFEVKILEAS